MLRVPSLPLKPTMLVRQPARFVTNESKKVWKAVPQDTMVDDQRRLRNKSAAMYAAAGEQASSA